MSPCLALLAVSLATAPASRTELIAAKLRMQFGASFALCDQDEAIFAFQTGVDDARQSYVLEQARWFAGHFAAMVDSRASLMHGLAVVILASEREYREAFGVPGMVAHYDELARTLITYQMSGAGTLFHELAHHFIRVVYGPEVPLWFNEGLASYFERRIEGRFGATNWRLPVLQRAERERRFIPLVALVGGERTGGPTFLAEARHLFVYLGERGVLERFLIAGKDRGVADGASLLSEVTGMSIAALEGELRSRVKSWRPDTLVVSP